MTRGARLRRNVSRGWGAVWHPKETWQSKFESQGRPLWAEVSLKALDHNLKVVRRHIGPKPEILAVVKSNGYGMGAVPVAKTLQKAGANRFGVTCGDEGIELRESGIRKPILVLTGFWPGKRSGSSRTISLPP